jgi:tetratricopeptide (TPR) repeat protein
VKRYLAAAAILVALAAFARAADSFDDVVQQAQIAVDTGRPEDAIRLYGRAAAMDPTKAPSFSFDLAWAYVQQALAAMLAENYQSADDLCAKAIKASPDVDGALAAARVFVRHEYLYKEAGKARAGGASSNWTGVIKYARDTVAVSVDSTLAHFDLATVYEYAGAGEKAAAEYRAVVKGSLPHDAGFSALRDEAAKICKADEVEDMPPLHPVQRAVEPGGYQILEAPPFVIHHHNKEFAGRVARALQYYISHPAVDGLLEARKELPVKCHVYIHKNMQEMQLAANCPGWAAAFFHAGKWYSNGELQLHLRQDCPGMIDGSLPHELGHLRLAVLLGKDRKAPPIWLNEGVATSAEPLVSTRHRCQTLIGYHRAGIMFHTADIMRMNFGALTDQYVHVAYAEAQCIVGVFAEKGNGERLRDFCESLKKDNQAAVLKKEYNITADELDRAIVSWAERHGGETR